MVSCEAMNIRALSRTQVSRQPIPDFSSGAESQSLGSANQRCRRPGDLHMFLLLTIPTTNSTRLICRYLSQESLEQYLR